MAKRVADRELTDRNWDQEDEVEEAGHFSEASEDTLKKRHVLKAKRRGGGEGSSSFSSFAGFSGFKPVQTSTPFSFNTKSMTNGKVDQAKEDEPKSILKTTELPKFNGTGNKNENNKDEKRDQYVQNLRNLNESVLAWIKQHVEKNPYCILTPIFNDYDKHLKEIESEFPEAEKKNQESVGTQEKQSIKESPTSSSSASPVATSNSLMAQFKPKPGAKPAAPSSSSSLLDKFKPAKGDWACDTCLVSNKGDQENCVACESPKPGAQTKAAEKPTKGFSIDKNAFNSGSSFNIKGASGSATFSFGSSSSTENSSKSFSFGSTNKKTNEGKSFSIGTNGNANSVEKSSFDAKSPVTSGGSTFKFGTSTLSSSSQSDSLGTSTTNSESNKGFSFGNSKTFTDKSPVKSAATFSFGTKTEDKKSEDTTTTTSSSGFSGFSFKSTNSVFGGNNTSTSFGTSSGFGASGFNFAVGNAQASSINDKEEEEYVPPKAESVQVAEEGSLFSIKCKLFYQKEEAWTEKGVGFLHLKMSDDKLQLLVRTDTTLGNILLNIMVPASMPIGRQGKNNLSLMCVPNPPLNPKEESTKAVPMLVRVKTGEDADTLLEKINELRNK